MGLRESRFESEVISNATGLSVLANVYNIEVTLFGNTNFVPGMKIFIDPSGLGGGNGVAGSSDAGILGRPNDVGSAAYKLGIGGYHTVYRVDSFIESGKYETTVKATFEGTGQRSPLGEALPNPNRNALDRRRDDTGDGEEESCTEAERAVDLLFGHRAEAAGG